ncbi:MAG: aldehyde dehydrogenase family protein [Lunatimonas sp.]|uniref:aldehyde dehydrogenase family protein n=1 Tax=Lunatimonas sp. TaxID=2060141 RepID=UPI00263AAA68|nr:aldehyde dehydrogenase family protein [Lunatimonas sp.]MCC5939554.1 aldehyde dehydrogenase family protein [Lunatimonas sp.]
MQVINPATGALINEIPSDTKEHVLSKIEKLRKGQPLWADVPVEERLAILLRFGELVADSVEELAFVLTQETGKPLQQSINEIKGANNRLVHLEANATKWLAEEVMVSEGATKEQISYEPLGVVANISAWNFPYNVGYNVFLYALVAGNSVVYKPSEFASMTGLKFRELLWKAGVPEYAFECVIGTGEVGQMLLEADLDGYFFTGSYATGRYIATQVAPKLVPMQLELGGKDPLYVMDDVIDVRQAAINAAEGAFYNNGQSCCAVERIYVQEGIYDQFVEHFIEEVKSYKMGDPMDKSTFIGPLTREPQVQVLLDQVQDALLKGAELKHGGFSPEGEGYYFTPTVLTSVNHGMDLMKEESFGPIIGIQKVANDEEALKLMKDTSYGLTAAVFATDKGRAMQLLKQLPVGTVYWNCCDRVSPNVPWSGRKNSGLGSTLSYQGIRAFVQPKAYHLRD